MFNNRSAHHQVQVKANHNITSPQVRLVSDGESLGIFPIRDAKEMAWKQELDLVEIVPNATPPVCIITDLQKYKYDLKLEQKKQKNKVRSTKGKEIRLRYCTDGHDIETKVHSIRKFIEEKRQVRIIIKFKNRELAFKHQGMSVMQQLLSSLEDVAKVDSPPRMDGKSLVANISPKV